MLLLALRRQRAAGETGRDSRAVVSVSSILAGPRPSRARRARGAAPPAASPRATYSRSSSSRPRVAVLTSRRTAAQPPAEVAFYRPNGGSPRLRRAERARGLWSSAPSRRDSRALSAASSSLAGWILYVAALTVVSARGGLCSRAPSTRLASALEIDRREHRCQWGQVSFDGNGANFPSRKT